MPATPTPAETRWRLYSVEEAVEILGKSRATLYRLIKTGLPHHNVRGTGVCFTSEDFDKILADSARGQR